MLKYLFPLILLIPMHSLAIEFYTQKQKLHYSKDFYIAYTVKLILILAQLLITMIVFLFNTKSKAIMHSENISTVK